MKTISFKDDIVSLSIEQYVLDNSPAIHLIDEDGCPYMMASVHVPGLKQDEVAIKDYAENEGILDALIQAGIVSKPHRQVSSGYVTIPVCKLLTPNDK
jgi:hypothetical protein